MTIQAGQIRRFVRPFIILFAVSASFQACKGENNEPDDGDDVVNPGGEGNDDGASGGRKASGGSGNGSGGKKGSGGESPASGGFAGSLAGAGNESGGNGPIGSGGGFEPPPDREDCPEEPNGDECWDLSECNGVESIQFLEQCSGSCVFGPFDNTKIEGFDGALPPLT